MKKVVFKIIDMHCASCAMTIDGDLEDTGRVKSAKTNYTKGTSEVEFDPDKITPQEIMTIIKNSGYTAKAVSS